MADTAKLSLNKNLRLSMLDGAAYSLMAGLGETYLPVFMLAAGQNEIRAGAIAVVPLACASIIQILIVGPLTRVAKNKTLVIALAVLQCFTLLGLAYVSMQTNAFAPAVWVLATVYWACAITGNSLWNVWVNKIVEPAQRIQFFSARTTFCQLFALCGFAAGGWVLSSFGRKKETFILLFGGALVARIISIVCLARQDSADARSSSKDLSPISSFSWLRRRENLLAVSFFLFFHCGASISSPYFTPYMLVQLEMTTPQFTVLMTIPLACRMICYTIFRRLNSDRQIRGTLALAAFAVSLLPYLWTLTTDMNFLILFQALSGLFWGAFELSLFLYFLSTKTDADRSRMLAWMSLISSLGMICGQTIGANIFYMFGITAETYHEVFRVSTLFRLFAMMLLPALLQKRIRPRQMFVRLLGVRSNSDSILRPILTEKEK